MNHKFTALVLTLLFVLVFVVSSDASGMFVATAKNLRGALYQGFGPTPGHASEMALVKCTQDTFIPPTCRVIAVRLDCPPPMMAPPPARKPIRKSSMSKGNPSHYSWGQQRP